MKRLISLMMCAVSISLFAQTMGCTADSTCYSNTFIYTGAAQTYVVPDGISSITIEAWGAQGGSGGGGGQQGGYGGYVTGILTVFSGQTLHVYVGGQGGVPGPGWNGGGNGTIGSWWSGAGGGGASDVRIDSGSLTDRVIVAGGGGGGGAGTGGVGGGLIGGEGSSAGTTVWALGGTQSSGGAGGLYNNNSCAPGTLAADGALGVGGDGINGSNSCPGGGFGGGGGYYGGGGSQISSAGGGSSYIGGVTDAITSSGVRAGDGLVVICAYISQGACDCAGNVLDECGICGGENSCLGCTEEAACNFDVTATQDDGSCTYDCYGCTSQTACNFSPAALEDDGSCDYSCCPGPGCCGEGTTWNWQTSECDVTNPSDSNFDGCVQLNDLLDLLSAYGDCGAEESPWQCGDPLEYQGYDYATVQIGEQCWFAENLRAENYRNGDEILTAATLEEWNSTDSGATAIYGEGEFNCVHSSPDFNACDPILAVVEYGRLYNGYSVVDPRGVCPSGWGVPSDSMWMDMEVSLGMTEEEAGGTGNRGVDEGQKLKSTTGWAGTNNGNNLSGFSGQSSGRLLPTWDEPFLAAGEYCYWWSSSMNNTETLWARRLNYDNDRIGRYNEGYELREGLSIRCIKDAE